MADTTIRTRGMRIGDGQFRRLQRLTRLTPRPQYCMLNMAIDEFYSRTLKSTRHGDRLRALEAQDADEEAGVGLRSDPEAEGQRD